MLEIIRSHRKKRDFIVYDLEWIPGTLELRLVGVFDGKRGYRCYRTIEAFLDNELNTTNRGKWFYAHAGGLADVQFLFETFVKRQMAVKASFSGSSAIIVHVGTGSDARALWNGNSLGHDCYHFCDSYWLLRDTLKNIGKSIGMEKGGAELTNDGTDEAKIKAWFRDVSLHELIEYNKQDCEILWRAIDAFQNKLWDFGGQLNMTIASSAMSLFRREYLTQDIPTSGTLNELARETYFSSRVEVFSREAIDSNYYDVNSSFPFSMTQPVPGRCLGGTYGKLPTKKDRLYIAELDVEVPDCYLPPLPIRSDGRVFFPVGRWKGRFNSVDVALLLQEGGKIHRVGMVHSFEPFHDLKDYALTLYEKRKATKDEFEKYCYKLLLNALYGKFAESDIKAGLYINPSTAIMETFSDETQNLLPGVFLHPESVPVPHIHVPISSHITAYSRGPVLYHYMAMSDDLHYTDTDGFSTGAEYPTSNSLGKLKHEKRIKKGLFVAPKLYQIQGETLKDGKWEPETVTRAKGFSLGRDKKRAEDLFLKLVNDGEIKVRRMDRVKQLLRSGNLKPRESDVTKRLKKNVMSKRFMYPDGSTRPWYVEELQK